MIGLGVWRHLKTGKDYLVTGTRLNCTNGPTDGTLMVDYENKEGKKFTREAQQFIDLFSSRACL